ncbi:MAG: DoxX family protein [Pseudomonadota bacterium]
MVSFEMRGWLGPAIWVAQLGLAAVFVFAAFAKFYGLPNVVAMFDQIGFGDWFRYFSAIWQLVGAALLLTRRFAWIGAGLILASMIGAIIANVFVGGNAIPAAFLGSVATFVLWMRRPNSARFPVW